MTSEFEPAYFETRFRTQHPVDQWPDQFAIISAYATTGETWTLEQNLAADQALEAELRANGHWLERITGYSPTSGHAEPSWAVDVSLTDAKAIGRRFTQDAIWWVSNGALHIVKCAGVARTLLGGFPSRLDQG